MERKTSLRETLSGIPAHLLPVAIMGGLLAVLVACGTGPIETREDTFTVGASPHLVIDSHSGSVEIEAGSDGTVHVAATLRRADRLDYEAKQDGDTITIVAKESRGTTFGQGPGADLVITAPKETRVDVRTSNGGVEVSGLLGSIDIDTSNGGVRVSESRGSLTIETSNGRVTASDSKGPVRIRTSNGRIEFAGELLPGTNNEMRTSNGSVDVTLRGTPSVEVDASTSNGDVASSIPLLTRSTGDDENLKGAIGDGEASLVIRTSNGSVNIK